MKKSSRKYSSMLVTIIMTLFTACQGASVPATPNPEVLRMWGDKDSSVTVNRLGKGTAYAMALSPDGKTIAVTGLLSVSTYDFDSLQEIWTSRLEPTQPPFTTGRGKIVWSPDGSQLATASEVGFTVWDAKSGEQLHIFKGHQYANVDSMIWTQDGRLAAPEYTFGHILLRDIETRTELFKLETNEGPVPFELLQGGEILAFARSDGKVVAWNAHTKQDVFPPLKACDGFCVTGLKWSPDGTRLASSVVGDPDQVIMWDAQTGKRLFTNDGTGNYSVVTMAWSPDNDYLAAAFMDGIILVWDANTGEQVHRLRQNKLLSLAWSLDGDNLISLSQYESITVWDVQTGKKLRSLDKGTGWILDLGWSPDGSMLASSSENGEVAIWDPSGKELRSFHVNGWVDNITWSPDGKQLATSANSIITIWKPQTGKQIRRWAVADTWTVVSLAWSPDGSRLASISYDGTGILWEASTGKELLRLRTIWSNSNLAWSPQGDVLTTSYFENGSGREYLTLWDPQTGEQMQTHTGFYDLVWSPLGDMAASIWDNETAFGGDDTTLVLWDPRTGNELRRFDTGIFLSDIAWSPDGKFLIVGEDHETDRSLVMLDAQTGEEIHRLAGHYDAVTRVTWSPNGDRIATSSWDGTIMIWGLDPQ